MGSAPADASLADLLRGIDTDLRRLRELRAQTLERAAAVCKLVLAVQLTSAPAEAEEVPAIGESQQRAASSVLDSSKPLGVEEPTSIESSQQVATSGLPNPWGTEVLGRIQGAVERSNRSVSEAFQRACSGGSGVMDQSAFESMLEIFEPNLPQAVRDQVWSAIPKASSAYMTEEEFLGVCGPRVPRFPRVSPRPTPAEEQKKEPLGEAQGQQQSSSSSCQPEAAAPVATIAMSVEERCTHTLLYRLGTALRGQRTAMDFEAALARGLELTAIYSFLEKAAVTLSRAEITHLFKPFTTPGSSTIQPEATEALRRALEVAGQPAPEGVAWAQERLKSALKLEQESGLDDAPLQELLDSAAHAVVDCRELKASIKRHGELDDDEWRELLTTLDKQLDGRVLVAPLCKLVYGNSFVA